MEACERLWVYECLRLKQESNKAWVAFECAQKIKKENSLSSTGASKYSVEGDQISGSFLRQQTKLKPRGLLQRYLNENDFSIDLAKIIPAFYDDCVPFAQLFWFKFLSSRWCCLPYFINWDPSETLCKGAQSARDSKRRMLSLSEKDSRNTRSSLSYQNHDAPLVVANEVLPPATRQTWSDPTAVLSSPGLYSKSFAWITFSVNRSKHDKLYCSVYYFNTRNLTETFCVHKLTQHHLRIFEKQQRGFCQVQLGERTNFKY